MKQKSEVFVVFHCWLCDKRHDFLRGDTVHVRVGEYLNKYASKPYKWKGVGCLAYLEEYDPDKKKEKVK